MRKVLIVTYYFPPLGGAGVQRILKFIKYLPKFGYQPVVLTPDYRLVRFLKDKSLLTEIPDQTVVYTTPIIDINWFYKILYGLKLHRLVRWISEVLIFPDYQRQWLFFARQSLKKVMKKENIDLVYISSPPHSIQALGIWIKKKYNIPFVTDFRDPLTYNPLNAYNKLFTRYYNFENNILNMADFIIANTTINKNTYIEKFGIAQNKIKVITNGYDPADFTSLGPASKKADKIIISHIGRLYKDYNAAPLIHAIAKMKIKPDNVEIRFIGSIPDSDKKLIRDYNLSSFIELTPSCPHHEALNYGQESDYLVVILADKKFNNFIPGKTFEYIRSGKPILAIVPEDGSCAEVIRRTKTGEVVAPDNVNKISETLSRMIHDRDTFTYTPNNDQIRLYDRKYLTGELAAVFDDILKQSTIL